MEKLDDLVLEEASGGASGDGYVTVYVSIVWQGEALKNVDRVPSLNVALHDPEGTATTTVYPSTNWSTKFRVRKGVEFECWMDLRQYPFITKWDNTWDPHTCQFVYYLS